VDQDAKHRAERLGFLLSCSTQGPEEVVKGVACAMPLEWRPGEARQCMSPYQLHGLRHMHAARGFDVLLRLQTLSDAPSDCL
jgi:hypothetical protein